MAKKRGPGEGSIYKRKKDGLWVASINLGYQGGKRKRKTFYANTRGEVQRKLNKALNDQETGLPVDVGRQTVSQFLNHWLKTAVEPALAPKTVSSYHDIVRLHIEPDLGCYQLRKLAPQHVQDLVDHKQEAGLSPRTVAYIRDVLRIALNRALKWGLVSRNVAALVDVPRRTKHEPQPFTPEEARAFLEAARSDRLEALYTVALALGLRKGEATGLRWEDIDLDNQTLHVRYALQRINGKLQLKEPKTEKSRRSIDIPDVCVTALRRHKVRQMEEQLAMGPEWNNELSLVFTTTVGTPLDPGKVTDRFKKLLVCAGLRKQRFHDLRHGCASLLGAQGVPPRMVMEILGHTQLATTMDLYSHVFPAAKREAADMMNAALSPVEEVGS